MHPEGHCYIRTSIVIIVCRGESGAAIEVGVVVGGSPHDLRSKIVCRPVGKKPLRYVEVETSSGVCCTVDEYVSVK
jgi:hypothetical protein